MQTERSLRLTDNIVSEERPRSKPRFKKKKKSRAACVIRRILLVLLTVILAVLAALLGVVYVMEKGPSETARNLFVISCRETSAIKWVPNIFLSNEQVELIAAQNAIQETDDITDPGLVKIPAPADIKEAAGSDPDIDPDGDGIDIIDVSGSTFKGKMMVVYDPSRVFVGISGKFGLEEHGKTLPEIYDSYDNIVGAINGGGFDDRPGHMTGGEPWGIVMSQGEVLWGTPMYYTWDTIGITCDNKLVVGRMTVQEAVDMGVRDAVKFGPILIVNGEPVEALGDGSGLNPRTAIGQRADGAMLLLTIDGRQSNSIGASLADVRDVMLDFGAVNAANLDGGSSTSMIYNGEMINQNASLIGLRKMCTAAVVGLGKLWEFLQHYEACQIYHTIDAVAEELNSGNLGLLYSGIEGEISPYEGEGAARRQLSERFTGEFTLKKNIKESTKENPVYTVLCGGEPAAFARLAQTGADELYGFEIYGVERVYGVQLVQNESVRLSLPTGCTAKINGVELSRSSGST